MKKLMLGLVLSTLILTGCTSQKQKETKTEKITFKSDRDTNIYATISIPTNEEMSLVVMAHGFIGDREGCANFEPLAKNLSENGIASIRIDFPGNGESKEDYTAYDITNMKSDLDSAIAHMKENYKIKDVGVVGHSMGGRMAALYANENIKATALWAPAANNGLKGLYDFMGGEKITMDMYNEAKTNGKVPFKEWGEPFVNCSLKFFEENELAKPIDNLSQYDGALLIAIDEFDDYISDETMNAVIHSPSKIQVLNVKNADHIFDAADQSGSLKPREFLVKETAQFFTNNLSK